MNKHGNIVCNATAGVAESFLGYYTPLTPATIYNQLDTVKLLIEEYGADVNQKVGRKKDFSAIDCEKHKFWFMTKTSKKILDYLEEHSPTQNLNTPRH